MYDAHWNKFHIILSFLPIESNKIENAIKKIIRVILQAASTSIFKRFKSHDNNI